MRFRLDAMNSTPTWAYRLAEVCDRCGFVQGEYVCPCLDRYGERFVYLDWAEVRDKEESP